MEVVTAIATDHPAYAAGTRIKPIGFSIYDGTRKKKPVTMSEIYHAYVERSTVYQILPWNRRAWHSHKSEDNTNISIVWDGRSKKTLDELLALLCKEYGIEQEKPEDSAELEGTPASEEAEA